MFMETSMEYIFSSLTISDKHNTTTIYVYILVCIYMYVYISV